MKTKKVYLIGVSGGADSMALLDMTYKNKINIQVAHVNYQKRETANRDELCVQKYCELHKIKFHTITIKEYPDKGNFQKIARDMRYNFFKKICDENHLDGVLIAHHMDDFLETYFFKKQRNNFARNFGIQFFNIIYGVKVYRPLLNYTKKELRDYCLDNKVPFEDDESNFTDHYSRNKIRHTIIDKMSDDEKRTLMQKIVFEQQEQDDKFLRVSQLITNNIFDISNIKDFELISLGIINLLNNNKVYKISKKQLSEFQRIYNEKNKFIFNISGYDLIVENQKIAIVPEQVNYEYRFDTLDELIGFDNEHISIKKIGKPIEGVTLTEVDFPIVIRNFQNGDKIKMRYGYKKISRHCIDRKIPIYNRHYLPVIENKYHEIIFVDSMGCDVNHYSQDASIYLKSKINKI